jgi:hypothetical protein
VTFNILRPALLLRNDVSRSLPIYAEVIALSWSILPLLADIKYAERSYNALPLSCSSSLRRGTEPTKLQVTEREATRNTKLRQTRRRVT